MKHTHPILATILAAMTIVLASCQQNDTQLPDGGGTGRIVLSLSEPEAYVEVVARASGATATRAEQTLENISDYLFTVSGITADGDEVAEQPLTIADAEAILPAGTYTINVQGNSTLATAAATGVGTPFYAGSSVDADGATASFTVAAGAVTPVRVLLKPANAQLVIRLTKAFTDKYKDIAFTVGSRTLTLLTEDDMPTTSTEVTAYFPAGALTVAATARLGSQVTEIIPVSNAISLARGTTNTLDLDADPVNGTVIPTVEGQHSGEFD